MKMKKNKWNLRELLSKQGTNFITVDTQPLYTHFIWLSRSYYARDCEWIFSCLKESGEIRLI